MSVRIAPEPISIGVSHLADYRAVSQPITRPVEPAGGASNANSNQQQAYKSAFLSGQAPDADRAPGVDPATLPQSLFNASLIASQYKADAIIREQQQAAAEVIKDVSEVAAKVISDESSATPAVTVETGSDTASETQTDPLAPAAVGASDSSISTESDSASTAA